MKTEIEEIASPATMCRVCMATGEDHFTHLYDESPSGQTFSLHEMLQAICAPVFVNSESCNKPEMPAKVCNLCQDAIVAAFSLHQQCIETDRRLCEILSFEEEFNRPESNGNEQLLTMVVINEGDIPTEFEEDVSKTCAECGKLFSRRFTLLRHQQNGVCSGKSMNTKTKGKLLSFETECTLPKSNETDGEHEYFYRENEQSLAMVVVNEDEIITDVEEDISKTCSECGKLFSRKFTLLRHQQNGVCPGKSNNTSTKDPLLKEWNLPRPCLECGKEYSRKSTLERHLQKGICSNKNKQVVEDIASQYEKDHKSCTQCGKTFARAFTLNRHKRKGICAATKPKMFPCRICDKVYNTPYALQGHYKKHGASNVCPTNNVTLISEADLSSEDKKKSNPEGAIDGQSISSENTVMIKVEALDLMDDNENENQILDLAENVNVKSENESAAQQVTEDAKTCLVCLETVENIAQLKHHMRSCHQLYVCEVCDANFPTRHILWYHKLKHKEPNVTCTVCGKKLSNKYYLELHMMRHAGTKKHACELCSMRFITPGAKTNHMRIHKKERPFVCDICGKRVVTRASLAKHIREIHEKIKRHVCTVCSRKFASKSHLVSHTLTHTKEKPYKCQLCPQAYSQTNDLVRHVSRAHWTGKPYPCDRCDESFRLIQDLREHYRVHVPSGDGLDDMEEVRFNSMAIMETLFAKVKQQQAEGAEVRICIKAGE